jgi:hypothetical protein
LRHPACDLRNREADMGVTAGGSAVVAPARARRNIHLVAALLSLVRTNRHAYYASSEALQQTVLEKQPYTPQGSEEKKWP